MTYGQARSGVLAELPCNQGHCGPGRASYRFTPLVEGFCFDILGRLMLGNMPRVPTGSTPQARHAGPTRPTPSSADPLLTPLRSGWGSVLTPRVTACSAPCARGDICVNLSMTLRWKGRPDCDIATDRAAEQVGGFRFDAVGHRTLSTVLKDDHL